jgi:Protein of unknown function (DUF2889)
MPLPKSAPRKEIHRRSIVMHGYSREDGLYDIEGRITDLKFERLGPSVGRHVEAGEPLHDMWVRLVIDKEMLVHEAIAVTDASPYSVCPEIAPAVSALKGERMSRGWRAAISGKLGGVAGCTHIRELLNTMGSTAFQTMVSVLRTELPKALAGDSAKPRMLDSCYAHASDSVVVMHKYPNFYTGKPGDTRKP